MENQRPSYEQIKETFLIDQLNAIGDNLASSSARHTEVWKQAALSPDAESMKQIQANFRIHEVGGALAELTGFRYYQDDNNEWKTEERLLGFRDTEHITLTVEDFGPYSTPDPYHFREYSVVFGYSDYYLKVTLKNQIQPGFTYQEHVIEPYNAWSAYAISYEFQNAETGYERSDYKEVEVTPALFELFYETFRNQEENQIEVIPFQKRMEKIKMVNMDTGETEYYDPNTQEWRLPSGEKSDTPLERLPRNEGSTFHVTAGYEMAPLDEGEVNPFTIEKE